MKTKSILMVILLMSLSFSVVAQRNFQPPSAEESAKKLTEKMKVILALDEKQEKDVYDLNLEYAKKRRELFENRGDDREEMRLKMREINLEYDKELKELLTEEQYKKYIKEKENLFPRPQGNSNGRPPRGNGGNRR